MFRDGERAHPGHCTYSGLRQAPISLQGQRYISVLEYITRKREDL